MIKTYIIQNTVGDILLHGDAFWPENTGAIYQREMSIIFRDHLRKTVECYVNDITVKSRNNGNNLYDLRPRGLIS